MLQPALFGARREQSKRRPASALMWLAIFEQRIVVQIRQRGRFFEIFFKKNGHAFVMQARFQYNAPSAGPLA